MFYSGQKIPGKKIAFHFAAHNLPGSRAFGRQRNHLKGRDGTLGTFLLLQRLNANLACRRETSESVADSCVRDESTLCV